MASPSDVTSTPSRTPGYYWIQPVDGGEWLVGYWCEGGVDVFENKSPGYFDCSNHWGDHTMVSWPFKVGPLLQPHHDISINKADVSRLRRIADRLDKEEQRLLKVAGPTIVPRSIRATNLADSKAIKRILEVIDGQ